MMTATHYFQVNDGILVPVYGDLDWSTVLDQEVYITINEFGLMVTVGDLEIPIPESMFDYISDNRTISLYKVDINNEIMARPVAAMILKKDSLVEAKGAYRYAKLHGSNTMDAKEPEA